MAIDQDLFFARRLGFGLGLEEKLPASPREWAMGQLKSVPPLDFFGPDGKSIASTLGPDATLLTDFDQACRQWEVAETLDNKLGALSNKMNSQAFNDKYYHDYVYPYIRVPRWRDCLAQSLTAVNGQSPVFERFWLFWTNHFTVSTTEAFIKLWYGPHTRVIRNRLTGSFADLLFDAVTTPAMVTYLDNHRSTGPHSQYARNSNASSDDRALNENLGREILELHTLSPAAGYTQKDVTETALVLTGWQFYGGNVFGKGGPTIGAKYGSHFAAERHEPGPRTILGKTYKQVGDGSNQLRELVKDLAVHPATAKHLSFKLARAFIADDPPQDCVDRIAAVYTQSNGDLVAVHSAVVEEVLALARQQPKLLTPVIWLLQAYKATGAQVPTASPTGQSESISFIYQEMGQSYDQCAQPNGWSELRQDWLSKEMLDRRVRQAYRIALSSTGVTPAALSDYAGRLAGSDSELALDMKRAESASLAMTVLLASPRFLWT